MEKKKVSETLFEIDSYDLNELTIDFIINKLIELKNAGATNIAIWADDGANIEVYKEREETDEEAAERENRKVNFNVTYLPVIPELNDAIITGIRKDRQFMDVLNAIKPNEPNE